MNTPTVPQPGTEYFNPADNQNYLVKQMVPGQGTILVNKDTQEESMLPEDVTQETMLNNGGTGLKPILKTQNLRGNSMADIHDTQNAGELANSVQDHLMEDIQTEMEEIERAGQGIEGDINEIVEDSQLYNNMAVVEPENNDSAEVITGVDIPTKVETDMLPVDEIEKHLQDEPLTFASTKKPVTVVTEHKPWGVIRAGLKLRSDVHRAAKADKLRLKSTAGDISYSPPSRDVVPSGHSKVNNIPVSGPPAEKKDVIGMTEFPKDHDRDENFYAKQTMKEMDERQVADREKFDNEHRQYVDRMTIRQLRALLKGDDNKEVKAIEQGKGLEAEREPVKSDDSDLYAIEKDAIYRAVGLSAVGIEFDDEKKKIDDIVPQDLPIKFKEYKRAPAAEEYDEPGAIEPASKSVATLIDAFNKHSARLAKVRADLQAALADKQREMQDIQTRYTPKTQKAQEAFDTALETLYNAISITEENILHYKEKLFTTLSHTKQVAPGVTVPQVVAEARLIDQHLADQIEDLAAKLKERGSTLVRERNLYEFPPSKEHQKRMKPEAGLKAMADSLVQDFLQIAKRFLFINSEIDAALELLEG